MLNTQFISVVCMVTQFQLNSEIKYVFIIDHVGITQQKHNKTKIANIKQTNKIGCNMRRGIQNKSKINLRSLTIYFK
jgi:hypothetical protein